MDESPKNYYWLHVASTYLVYLVKIPNKEAIELIDFKNGTKLCFHLHNRKKPNLKFCEQKMFGQIRSFLDMLWNLNYFPVRTIKGFVHNPTISKCVNVYCICYLYGTKIDDLSVSRYIWSLTSNLLRILALIFYGPPPTNILSLNPK